MFKVLGADGKEYGPATADQIREWIQQKRLGPQSMVLKEGATEWRPLSAFPEFTFPPGPGATPPPILGTPYNTGLPYQQQEIKTYLIPSIFVTLCCCLPLGLVAVYFAATSMSRKSAGDFEGARKAADNARLWCIIALIAGIASNFGVGWMMLSKPSWLPTGPWI
jgi:hypothetical protein